MLSNHKSVAIAQTIFYIPIMPVTFYILAKNWSIGARISRLTWLTLALLSLMRFAGGILVIVRESNPDNVGLAITALVILNVGLVPLIMSTLGMIGIVLSSMSRIENHNLTQKAMILFRLLFVAALNLLITGRAISLDGYSTGDNLVKAAYIVYATMISIIITIIFHLWFQKSQLAPPSFTYLTGATSAIPFVILRVIYGTLSAFLTPNIWNPLVGSAVAFALMALLPEYITIAIIIYLGFHRSQENALFPGEAAGTGCNHEYTLA